MEQESIGESSLAEIMRGVFLMTLELECVPAEETESQPDVRSVVGISGAWTGEIAIELPRSLASVAAARMFDVEEKAVSDADVLDAVGELSNQVAGSVKSVLPPPCTLGLPRPESVADGPTSVPVGATRYSFRVDGKPFFVMLSPGDGDNDV
ncbi:MAG: chemotaxis protein CheX [Nannocystales bacterium]